MFGYKRYSYSGRKRSYYYGRSGKYFRRGSSTARALGSARAAKNGSKVENYNCTVNGIVIFTQPANEYYANTQVFSPLVGGINPRTGQINDSTNGGIYGGLVNDRGYRLRCAQYDEMRIVSMKVKLVPQWNTGASGSPLIYPNAVLSIFDRCATREELAVDEASMTDIDHDVPSPREIEESAGVVVSQWNNNRISPIVRTVYARDVTEKQYSDCSIDYITTEGESPLATLAMEYEPNFCPAIYYTIKATNTQGTVKYLTFSYSVEYNVIFRNPKSDLQTFVVKENPEYVNPDESSKYTVVKSTDPHLPDKVLDSTGKEKNSSWYARYKARAALKSVGMSPVTTDDPPVAAAAAAADVGVSDTKTDMEMEDDPGTS